MIVCGGRVKRGNGGENSWSSSSRVCSWSTAGQEFPLAFGVPFPPSLCSFLQAVDKFPPYKSVTWAGTNGLKGKEPGLEGRRMTVRAWLGGSRAKEPPTRTWDSKRRLYGCQVSQGQVSHKTLGTLHLACHESLLLESHARSSISFMVGPLDGRVVRPWGTSSRHLVGAPPWGTRVPEGDCWHGGQGFLGLTPRVRVSPSQDSWVTW